MMLLDENNMAVQGEEFLHEVDPVETPAIASPVQPEARTFGIPSTIWIIMAASYIVFFGGLALATGHDGAAIFMIVISVLYTLMYFGTAFALNNVGAASRRNLPSQWLDGKLQTHTGPMDIGSVFGQMLVVPIMFALFGIAIAVIRFTVM